MKIFCIGHVHICISECGVFISFPLIPELNNTIPMRFEMKKEKENEH